MKGESWPAAPGRQYVGKVLTTTHRMKKEDKIEASDRKDELERSQITAALASEY